MHPVSPHRARQLLLHTIVHFHNTTYCFTGCVFNAAYKNSVTGKVHPVFLLGTPQVAGVTYAYEHICNI